MINALQLIIAVLGNLTELSLFCMIGDLLEQQVSYYYLILTLSHSHVSLIELKDRTSHHGKQLLQN